MLVSIGASDEEPCDVTVNHQLVSGYINAFDEISKKYGIPNDVSAVSLSRFPDVFTVHKAPEDEDQITADVLSAAKIAVDAFVAMREAEGEKMKEDILSRANTILSVVGEIEERSPQTVAEYEQRLMERIKQTLAENDVKVDEQRVLTTVSQIQSVQRFRMQFLHIRLLTSRVRLKKSVNRFRISNKVNR